MCMYIGRSGASCWLLSTTGSLLICPDVALVQQACEEGSAWGVACGFDVSLICVMWLHVE